MNTNITIIKYAILRMNRKILKLLFEVFCISRRKLSFKMDLCGLCKLRYINNINGATTVQSKSEDTIQR